MSLLIAFLAGGLPTMLQPAPCARLELVEAATNQVAWSALLLQGQKVVLGFTHSLYGVSQHETFVADTDGALRLREIAFGSHDAATYYDADPTPPLQHDNGVWRLAAGPERRVPPAPFRVGYHTEHFVEAGSQRVRVADYVEPGSLALLRLMDGCVCVGTVPDGASQ